MTEVAERSAVAAALDVEPGALVLVDGLVAGWAPDALEAAADRVRIVVLAHMVAAAFPGDLGAGGRRRTSGARVCGAGDRDQRMDGIRIRAPRAGRTGPGRGRGSRCRTTGAIVTGPVGHRDLLCVGAIAPHKGQDLLLDALALLAERDWTCTLAGSTAAYPDFSARIADGAARFDGRVRLTGVLDGAELDRAYRRCGVLGRAVPRGELRDGDRGCPAARPPGHRDRSRRGPRDGRRRRRPPRHARRSRGARRRASTLDDRPGPARPAPTRGAAGAGCTPRAGPTRSRMSTGSWRRHEHDLPRLPGLARPACGSG